jgi:hypothetical protein
MNENRNKNNIQENFRESKIGILQKEWLIGLFVDYCRSRWWRRWWAVLAVEERKRRKH